MSASTVVAKTVFRRAIAKRSPRFRLGNVCGQQLQQKRWLGIPSAANSVSLVDDSYSDQENNTRRLDVAIVGYPNAGKSQLLNALLGQKVAAVSKKRHTTRDGILGVATQGDAQLVFCDTPGFMTHPAQAMSRDLSMSASSHMVGVDYSLVVIDAAKRKHDPDYLDTIATLMHNALLSQGGKFSIVLNKVDLIKPKSELLTIAQKFGDMADKTILQYLIQTNQPPNEELLPEIFYTNAKRGRKDQGVQDVLHHLLELAIPDRDWLLPSAHQVTPMDYKARVEEIIREKIYRTLHREVPYQITQRNRQLELVRGETNETSVLIIQQDLQVYTRSHMNLLLKSGSGNLQRIQDAAISELRHLFQCEVLLTLSVKLLKRNQR
jgi:GTP-binding protein Era